MSPVAASGVDPARSGRCTPDGAGPPPPARGAERRLVHQTESLLRERRVCELDRDLLCAATGVSPAVLAGLFADCGELYTRVFDRVSARACRGMLAAYGSEGDWLDSVRAALFELLSFLDGEPGLARFLVVDSLTGDAAMLARRREVLERLAGALGDGAPSLEGASAPGAFGPEAVVHGVASVLSTRLLEQPARPTRELAGSLMATIVIPYLGVAAARAELSRTGWS